MKWFGIYNMGADTFTVFRHIEPHPMLAHVPPEPPEKMRIAFTEAEEALIEAVSFGREKFEWFVKHEELTEKSRAWWAMM